MFYGNNLKRFLTTLNSPYIVLPCRRHNVLHIYMGYLLDTAASLCKIGVKFHIHEGHKWHDVAYVNSDVIWREKLKILLRNRLANFRHANKITGLWLCTGKIRWLEFIASRSCLITDYCLFERLIISTKMLLRINDFTYEIATYLYR